MKFVTSFLLTLSLLPVANAQDFLTYGGTDTSTDTCFDCDCLKCTGVEYEPGSDVKTIFISGESCKSSGISWFCCRTAEGNEGDCGFASDGCGGTFENSGRKCKDVNTYKLTVPVSATYIETELHDGRAHHNGCPDSGKYCQGGNNPRYGNCNQGGGCTSEKGSKTACLTTIDLSTCCANGRCVGDPHFQTWAGHWYDYHGQCDLVFLTEPTFADGLGLDIHIRTTARDDFSFIESAAIRIGTDVLEVGGWGEHLLNGVDGAEFPAHLGPFPIHYEMENKKKHHYAIPYGKDKSIQIHTVKDLVTVQMVNASAFDFQNSGGMMGQFNTGFLIGRDGKTDFGPVLGKHNHHNEFGQEWQVREDEPKLFEDSARHPQAPEKCVLPEKKAATQRRLGETSINREDAEKACAHWGDAKEHCVFDVMAMKDLEVAEFPGAF